MESRIGQSLLDTKVLVRLNILVERISFRPSISRETRATDWPEILIDHQSIQPVKPFADGFQGLPSIALMKLGSSLPPSTETRPLSWMNSIISAWVFNRRLGLSLCSRAWIASAFLISALVFEPEHYPRFLEACISSLGRLYRLVRSRHFDLDLLCETHCLPRFSNTLAYGTRDLQMIVFDQDSIVQPQTMSIAASKLDSLLLKESQTWKRLPSTRNPDLAPTLSICDGYEVF